MLGSAKSVRSLQTPPDFVLSFTFQAFNTIIIRQPTKEGILDLLPYTHVSLIFLTSLENVRPYLNKGDPLLSLLDKSGIDWVTLARFLNLLASFFPITSRIEMLARSGIFPSDGRPLYEDYLIRGLVWCQWYFSTEWFQGTEDDDGSRALEDPVRQRRRAERVLWLGLTLAFRSRPLCYDDTRRIFSAAPGQLVSQTTKSGFAKVVIGWLVSER